MPELKTSYFGFPTGDMIECTHRKECYKKFSQKYFKIGPNWVFKVVFSANLGICTGTF